MQFKLSITGISYLTNEVETIVVPIYSTSLAGARMVKYNTLRGYNIVSKMRVLKSRMTKVKSRKKKQLVSKLHGVETTNTQLKLNT